MKESGDIFPSVAMLFVELKEKFFFVISPGFFVDCWIQMVIPSLSALFACPFADVVVFFELECDLSPVVEAVLSH